MGIITVRRYTISPLEKVTELRCFKCGSLLGRKIEGKGKLEIKCRKCKTLNQIKFT